MSMNAWNQGVKHCLGGWGLLRGLTYPFRSLTLLRQRPALALYIGIPLIINLAIGVVLYWQLLKWGGASVDLLKLYGYQGAQYLSQQLPDLMPWILPLLKGGFALIVWIWRLVLLLLAGFILSQVGVLLGSPWYGQLSEQIERQLLGISIEPQGGLWTEISRAIAYEGKKLAIIIGVGLMCVALQLLPALGATLATTLTLSTTTLLTCLDFCDPPLERRRLKFRQKVLLILRCLPQSAGFGVACVLWVSIPLVNLVTLPLCVMAGTLFFCEVTYPRFFKSPTP